jgi:phosphoribosylformylglycinamidine cyclo-ligase
MAGCALLGGETAEHPGLMAPDHYDLSATGVGVVEADGVLGPERVKPGDVIIAMASTGLHSNGYSLARKVLLEIDRGNLAGHVEEFGRTLGENYSSRPASTPRTASRWPPKPRSGRSATSPAADSPETWSA